MVFCQLKRNLHVTRRQETKLCTRHAHEVRHAGTADDHQKTNGLRRSIKQRGEPHRRIVVDILGVVYVLVTLDLLQNLFYIADKGTRDFPICVRSARCA